MKVTLTHCRLEKDAQKIILKGKFVNKKNVRIRGGGGGGGGGGDFDYMGRQDLGGPHVGPMNFAIWECSLGSHCGLLKLKLSGIKS